MCLVGKCILWVSGRKMYTLGVWSENVSGRKILWVSGRINGKLWVSGRKILWVSGRKMWLSDNVYFGCLRSDNVSGRICDLLMCLVG